MASKRHYYVADETFNIHTGEITTRYSRYTTRDMRDIEKGYFFPPGQNSNS